MSHSSEHKNDHAADEHPLDYAKTVRTYLKVGAVLIFFTFFTIAVAYMEIFDFGNKALNIGFGLLIATFKVSLVCLIFMHLNHERGLIYKTLLFTIVFAAAMMFLMVLTFNSPIRGSLWQLFGQ